MESWRDERLVNTSSSNAPRREAACARYIMVGGFLGSGKSTGIARLARRLTGKGLRVGLITNDQGSSLVDTRSLRSQGFSVEEIAGGCFCCRFNSLLDAARKLGACNHLDVFIAEPVGSCTDLVATVSYPLRRIYGEGFKIAPLSVLVDPIRALRVLGLEAGRGFSPKVVYVYRKQLEEADFIVINKCDLLSDEQCLSLRQALTREYPAATIFEVSARLGDGLDAWFDRVLSEEMRPGKTMEVDYEAYAEGEALLGWLNCTIHVSSGRELDGNALLREFAGTIQRRLNHTEVAHLKLTLSPDGSPAGGQGELGAVNLVRQDFVPELSLELAVPIESGEIILNLRAEADPDTLRGVVEEEIENYRARTGVGLEIEHLECFKPGKPVPMHRITGWSVEP